MAGLAKFKTGADLHLYLTQFEEIMLECEVEQARWNILLYSRLDEKMAERMKPLKDEGETFEVIKAALLKSVGSTPIVYGQRLYEFTS